MDEIGRELLKRGPFVAAHYILMGITKPEELKSWGILTTLQVIKLFLESILDGDLVLACSDDSTLRLKKKNQKVNIL